MSEALMEMPLEPAGVPRGRAMVERASWAARSFTTFDIHTVRRVAKAAALAGEAHARQFAQEAVEETGFGVAEHKFLKNVACSIGIWNTYESHDYVTPTIVEDEKIVEVPRPAGVVLALTPSTNPVATVYFKIMLALLTRNSIIISPHPYAKDVCKRAAYVMRDAAIAEGAPDGIIQVVEEPSIPLINALMTDERVDVIVATGGTPMVRSAYRSGNPAIGVGPGNVPVFIDKSADLAAAAQRLVVSKSFDNSILCTNESVLIVEEAIADRLSAELRKSGAQILEPAEVDAVRDLIFPGGHFDTAWVGKSAVEIAEAAGIKAAKGTIVLIAPIDLVVPEESLAHEKLCPVLAMVTVSSRERAIEAARAVLRITGRGHSAAIHSQDADITMRYAAALPVLRVSVNVGNSLGSAGIETGLAPTMTIGTGFFGRSSVGENLQPKHLINRTRIAYNSSDAVQMPDFAGLDPWSAPTSTTPAYPFASNLEGAPVIPERSTSIGLSGRDDLRDEIRRLVIEELQQIIKG